MGTRTNCAAVTSIHLQPDSLCGFLEGLWQFAVRSSYVGVLPFLVCLYAVPRYRSINTPVSASSPSKTIMATPYDYDHVIAEQEYQPDRPDRRKWHGHPIDMVLKAIA